MALHFVESKVSIVNDQSLNLFLVPLSNMGKMDQCLMIYKWFNEKLGVCGNLTTFKLLLKSHVRNGYSKNFPLIYEWIQRLFKSKIGINYMPNNYWKLKCQSIIKFNCIRTDKFTDFPRIQVNRLKKMDRLYETFDFDSLDTVKEGQFHEIKLWNISKGNPEIRKMLRFLNVVKRGKSNNGDNNEKRSNFITNNSKTKIRKRKFLQRIKKIAITHSSYKKLSYSQNWYKALNDEFSRTK